MVFSRMVKRPQESVMNNSRIISGITGLFGFAAAISFSLPVSGNTSEVLSLEKADRQILETVAVADDKPAATPVFITIETRFPQEQRSVLTRVPR